jgi:PAS domain S-box-containing protein
MGNAVTSADLDANLLAHVVRDGDLLRALADESDCGVCVLNRARRILYWNAAAERITGRLAQEVAGCFCTDDAMMNCDDCGAALCNSACPVAGVIEDGRRRESQMFLRHRRGHRIPVRVRAHPIRDGAGQIVGAIELFHRRAHPLFEDEAGQQEDAPGEGSGVVSREHGAFELEHALASLRRFLTPFSWMRIELDNPGKLDARYGRGFGDAAAIAVANTLQTNLGAGRLVIRWSRTGFRALLRRTAEPQAAEMARLLSVLVRASTVEWWGDAREVGISAAAVAACETDSLESLEYRVAEALERNTVAGPAGRPPSAALPAL